MTGVTPDQLVRFRELTASRARRTPLQYLTGTAPFRHLELAVGPGVFVPRPETELVAGWGLAALTGAEPEPGAGGGAGGGGGGGGAPTVVDLCSGSGAIALSVAHECPAARVYAVEADPAALTWLRRNAADTPVTVVEGDATDPAVLSELDGRVDLLLCNPPYVPDGTAVPPEVADHDPAAAVFAGADGLAVIRGVVRRATTLLRPGGALVIEHDDSHAVVVPGLIHRTGAFEHVEDHLDLAGRPRFATAHRLAGWSA